MFKKIFSFISGHKILTGIIIIIVIAGGYFGIASTGSKKAATKYVVSTVTKGDLITTVSATGQVDSSNEIKVTSSASGEVTYVGATVGQDVKEGDLLMKIDDTDAQRSLREAQANLDLAQLALEQEQEPVDQLTLLQAQNALTTSQQTKQTSQDDLSKSYDDGFTQVSNSFLDLPSVMTGLNSVLFGNDFSKVQQNSDYYASRVKSYNSAATQYETDAYNKYQAAYAAYSKNFSDYKATSRYSSTDTIDSLLSETYDTAKTVSEAVKSANNLIQFYEDQMTSQGLTYNTMADTQLSTLDGYTSKVNTDLSSLLSSEQTIANDKQAIINADADIQEKQVSLQETQAGPTALDLKTKEVAVEQAKNSLLAAQETLNNYYIYAPFSGTVAEIDVNQGDTVSSGASLITFISKGRIAAVSLNEIDVPKIKVGDDVSLTFDAVSDVTLTGKVSQIDTIGTVSSGVVYYDTQISFDDASGKINPGMSVSASIISDAKKDVLMVSNSAVKSSNGSYYVQVPATNVASTSLDDSKGVSLAGGITSKTVEIGSANDTDTEITSGLNENDQVITSTVTGTTASSSKTSTSSSSSLTRSVTGTTRGFGGGGF